MNMDRERTARTRSGCTLSYLIWIVAQIANRNERRISGAAVASLYVHYGVERRHCITVRGKRRLNSTHSAPNPQAPTRSHSGQFAKVT